VADVVQQRRELEARPIGGIESGVTRFFQLGEDASRQMICAERVLEAAVGGAGVDEEGVAELADVTEPLHGRGVDHRERFGVEPDVVPERVADDFEAGRHGA